MGDGAGAVAVGTSTGWAAVHVPVREGKRASVCPGPACGRPHAGFVCARALRACSPCETRARWRAFLAPPRLCNHDEARRAPEQGHNRLQVEMMRQFTGRQIRRLPDHFPARIYCLPHRRRRHCRAKGGASPQVKPRHPSRHARPQIAFPRQTCYYGGQSEAGARAIVCVMVPQGAPAPGTFV